MAEAEALRKRQASLADFQLLVKSHPEFDWRRGAMPAKSWRLVLLISLISSCAHPPSQVRQTEEEDKIVYMSLDRQTATTFDASSARINRDVILRDFPTGAPLRFRKLKGGIDCVIIGNVDHPISYAIKRPISLGETYRCEEMLFTVTECFDQCRNAIIAIRNFDPLRIPNNNIKSTIYVNSCIGIVMFDLHNIYNRMDVFTTHTLVTEVGILADQSYPKCKWGVTEND